MQSEYSPRDAREPTQGNAFPHGRFALSAERPRAASSTSEEVHEIVRSPARELEPDQCDSRSERGSAQNCKAGKEPGALTSIAIRALPGLAGRRGRRRRSRRVVRVSGCATRCPEPIVVAELVNLRSQYRLSSVDSLSARIQRRPAGKETRTCLHRSHRNPSSVR